MGDDDDEIYISWMDESDDYEDEYDEEFDCEVDEFDPEDY